MSDLQYKVPAGAILLGMSVDDDGAYVLIRREDGAEEKLRPHPPLPTFVIEADEVWMTTPDPREID